MPPSPSFVEASLTCWRYWPAAAGVIGAGVGVEPVCHFGLVFCGGMLVAEYVRDLAFFAVVWAWDEPGTMLRGTTWDAEGVPEESVLVRDGAGGACEVHSE